MDKDLQQELADQFSTLVNASQDQADPPDSDAVP